MARGHVRYRGNGKWQLEVDLGKTIGGKKRNRKYRTVEAKNKKEAELLLAQFVAELTNEGYIEEKDIGFIEFVNKHWVPKCAVKRLSHTTLSSYINRIETRIFPAFQYFKLNEVEPIHIIDFLDQLQQDGVRLDGKYGKLSSSSIRFYYRILKNIFDFAVEIKFLKENPVESVKRPSEEYKEIEVYNEEEAIKLMEALDSEVDYPHWQVIIKLAISTGMRRSELYGLEFKHIDLDNQIVHVRQALTYSKEFGFQIHEIKKGNRSARKRDVALPESLVEPIRQLRLQRRKERLAAKNLWQDGKYDLVLCHPNGKPYHPDAMRLWWKNFLERHNLKYINIHALRHTSATLLINEGVHPKVISERLGHSSIKTTMNVYGHVLEKADKKATEKIEHLLFKNNEKQ